MSNIVQEQELYFKQDVVYDLETFPSCFTMCCVDADGSNLVVYECSDRKDDTELILEKLRSFIRNKNRMVSFNGCGFDYPILHEIIQQAKQAKQNNETYKIDPAEIYKFVEKIIGAKKESRFGYTVKAWDVIIPQLDLYLLNHFDNMAKATSLKMLEFNMRSDNIEDLPFPVGTHLTSEQIDVLIKYNKHDVLETRKFYLKCYDAIKFREELSQSMGMDCTNFNDTKIGKEFFIKELEKSKKGCCYKYEGRKRKLNQTKRDIIHLKDVILPYIKFESPEFNAILNWFKLQSISETKGVFTDLQEHELGEVAKYAELTKKNQKCWGFNKPSQDVIDKFLSEKPCGWIEERELKSGKKGAKSWWKCWNVAESLNVKYKDMTYWIATGGIHSCIDSGIYESDENWSIIERDYKSFYPNLAISNKISPEHLGDTFCDVYKKLYDERTSHKKGTPQNALLKLALNGSFGAMNDKYSPFFDPKALLRITVNGQLTILMLVERLYKNIPEIQILMTNTDAVVFRYKNIYKDLIDETFDEYEKMVKLETESTFYKKMCIRDCNSYIAVEG